MLKEIRKKVIEVARAAAESGLCKHKSGNFSIKDPETGYVAITPSGVARRDLKPEDIPIVDLAGKIIELKSGLKPSSELKVHLMAYKCREDVRGVCHTHSPFATAFAVQSKKIKPVVFEALVYGVEVPVAPYGRPGTQALAESIVEPLKKSDACLLEKHGVLTVGKDLEEAYLKAQYVEEVAQIYLYSLMLGDEPGEIPPEEFAAVTNA